MLSFSKYCSHVVKTIPQDSEEDKRSSYWYSTVRVWKPSWKRGISFIHHWISTDPPPHARGRTWFFRKIRKNHDDFLRKNHVLPEEILYGTTRFFRKIRENKFFFYGTTLQIFYGRTWFFRILRKNIVLPYFPEEPCSSGKYLQSCSVK